MNYLLTQEEYDALRKTQQLALRMQTDKLQKLCSHIADTMPVKWGWGGDDPKPWGCSLTKRDEWYCDQCPVQEICPNPYKHYSK